VQYVRKAAPRRFIAVTLAALTMGAVGCASRGTQVSSGGEVALPSGDTGRVARDTGNISAPANASVDRIVASWPANPKMAASKLTAKYGQPDVVGDRMLVWYNKGPYTKIAIARDEQPHSFPMPHTDFLTSTVKYKIPGDKVSDLFAYDGSVWFHRTRGELSAQCDMEELNNLALNLAVDIATGKRTVDDARAFYAKTAMEFKQGKTNDYLSGLRFQPASDAADTDKPHQM
jgi:hypothetical protein